MFKKGFLIGKLILIAAVSKLGNLNLDVKNRLVLSADEKLNSGAVDKSLNN